MYSYYGIGSIERTPNMFAPMSGAYLVEALNRWWNLIREDGAVQAHSFRVLNIRSLIGIHREMYDKEAEPTGKDDSKHEPMDYSSIYPLTAQFTQFVVGYISISFYQVLLSSRSWKGTCKKKKPEYF